MGASLSSPLLTGIMLSDLLRADDVNWNIVSQLLKEEPEQACLYLHSVENSPLQVALSRSAPSPVVSLFVEAYEDALWHTDCHGNSVVHSCVDAATECDASLNTILKYNSKFLSQCNKEGKLPLHMNLRDPEATKTLIRSYPQGLRQRDSKGRVPLHYALSQQDGIVPNVVRVMASALNGNTTMRDKAGVSPLDLLVNKIETCFDDANELTEEGVELWKLFLDMIRILPSKLTPDLHKIVDLACPLRVMLHALVCFPEQASLRDAFGRTPLHVAAIRTSYGAVISKLVALFPSGARMTDHEGRLAIDLAAEQGKDSEVMEALILAEPRAVDTRDLRDKRYPFLSAALGDHETVTTTYYLLRAKPHVISYFNLA